MKVCIITTSDGYGWPVTQEVEDMMVAYIYYEYIWAALEAEWYFDIEDYLKEEQEYLEYLDWWDECHSRFDQLFWEERY